MMMSFPGVICSDSFFENSNITIHMNNDFKVNGTLTIFDFGEKPDNKLMKLLKGISMENLKSDKNMLTSALGKGPINDIEDNEMHHGDQIVEEELRGSRKPEVIIESSHPEVINSRNAASNMNVHKQLEKNVKDSGVNYDPYSNVINQRDDGDSNQRALVEVTTQLTSIIKEGDDGKLKYCESISRKISEKYYRMMVSKYKGKFGSSNVFIKYEDDLCKMELTEIMQDLCIEDEWFVNTRICQQIYAVSFGTYINQKKLIKASSNDIVDFMLTELSELSANLAAEIMNHASSWISKNVFSKISPHSSIVKDSNSYNKRSLLAVNAGKEEEDDIMNLDIESLSEMLKKKMRISQKKMSSLKMPMAEAFKGPSLIDVAKLDSIHTKDKNNKSISASWSSILVDKTKKIVMKEYITSKSPSLIGLMSYDPEDQNSKIVSIIGSLVKVSTYKPCQKVLPYIKQMIDTCTIGYSLLELDGKSLCVDHFLCPNTFLNSKLECVEREDCISREIIINHRSKHYSNASSEQWSPAKSLISKPLAASDVICSINEVDLEENAKECNSGRNKKSKFFHLIDLIILKNGSQMIGIPDSYTLEPFVGGELTTAFSCEPESECLGCLLGTKRCYGDDFYCKREGIMCTHDSECTCRVNEFSEIEVLKKTKESENSDDALIEVDRINSVWATVELITGTSQDAEYSQFNCEISTSCDLGQISVMSPCIMRNVKIEVSGRTIWEEVDKSETKNLLIPIPWDITMKKSNYELDVYFRDAREAVKRSKGSCKSFRVCDRVSCIFCKESLKQARCWSLASMMIPLVTIPIVIVIFIWIIGFTLIKIGILRRTVIKIVRIKRK